MKKNISLILTLSIVSVLSFGATNPTLKQNMKEIKTLFVSVGKNVKDASQNLESAAAATKLADLFKATLEQIPDAIQSVPDANKAAARADFQRIIADEVSEALALHDAFVANDNAAAEVIITKMNADKKEGHGKYNP